MPYFHVLVATTLKVENFECIAQDISENYLIKQAVRPYKNGKAMIFGSRIIPIEELRGIKIIETEEASDLILSRATNSFNESIDKINSESNSSVVIMPFFGYGPDALEQLGKDVTAKYISQAPGQGSNISIIGNVINHPWIVGVGTAVLATGIAAWLKWN